MLCLELVLLFLRRNKLHNIDSAVPSIHYQLHRCVMTQWWSRTTLLSLTERWQQHHRVLSTFRFVWLSSVNAPTEWWLSSVTAPTEWWLGSVFNGMKRQKSLRIRCCLRKWFSLWIRGLGGDVPFKKKHSWKILWDCPFKLFRSGFLSSVQYVQRHSFQKLRFWGEVYRLNVKPHSTRANYERNICGNV
jgi:hypothetical protein